MATAILPNTLLASTRIKRVIDELPDFRQKLPVWASRINDVPADEDEVLLRISAGAAMASLVADGAAATVGQLRPWTLSTSDLINLKWGVNLGQSQMAKLTAAVAAGVAGPALQSFDSALRNILITCKQAVINRRAYLVSAMVQDAINYDANGVKITDWDWGMPSDLKVTLSGGRQWSAGNESTAKPVTDVLDQVRLGQDKYGIVYDRVTMARADFQFMVTTDEFRTLSSVVFQRADALTSDIVTLPDNILKNVAANVLGMDVELDDSTYITTAADGTDTNGNRYVPLGTVILSSKAHDNDNLAWDMANVPVTEAAAAQIMGQNSGMIGDSLAMGTRGPVGFATGNPGLNPPDITVWSVMRGFPRRFHRAVTSVILATG